MNYQYKNTVYKYDAESKLIRSYVYDSVTMENLSGVQVSYDLQSRVSQVLTSFDYTVSSGVSNEAMMYLYSYDNTTGDLTRYNVSGLNSGVSVTVNPTYDRFGRTTNKNILGEISDVDVFYNQLTYDYKTNGTNESGLISQIISKVGQSSTGTLTTTTYNYTYDNNGNITQITDSSGVVQNKYTYDDLGQLTREDNRALNKSYVWTYDNAGNILSKKTYAFTTGTLGVATSTVNYTYGNSNWGDQLTNFNGAAITYDTIGNPVSIGGFVLTWEGRQLKSFGDDYEFTNYTYNADGIRTVKEYGEYDYNGYRHEYTLNGSQIVREVVYYDDDGSGTYVESYMLVYIYDENGSPIGMKYRTPSMAADTYTYFFFEKNLQGDIVSVYNSAGVKVIAYTYDAWGNFTQTHAGGSASDVSVATKNPFRYRGYYYDTNTGFYYLQSRYYNPQWGRFLNADGLVSTGQGLLGYNMYAYCNNNPIRYVDSEGNFPWLVVAIAVALVVVISLQSCSSQTPSNTPRSDLANAPDLDVNTAPPGSYNCFGNGIGKQISADPTGYTLGDSTRKTFEAVKQDLGPDNVRELNSIDDPIGEDEFKVAMKCGPTDYHFIRLTPNGWYNKSGDVFEGVYIDESFVSNKVWFAMWSANGKAYVGDPRFGFPYYDDETIYFAVKVGWDKQ